jgi:hypothetical protein
MAVAKSVRGGDAEEGREEGCGLHFCEVGVGFVAVWG